MTRDDAAELLATHGYAGNRPPVAWPVRPEDVAAHAPTRDACYRRAQERISSNRELLSRLAEAYEFLLTAGLGESRGRQALPGQPDPHTAR